MRTSDTSDLFFFDRERMNQIAEDLHDRFINAEPYEHVVIDDFFPADFAARLSESFPRLGEIKWRMEGPGDTIHTGDTEVEKCVTSDEEQFPPLIRFAMMQFQSGIFCKFLDKLTGHSNLIPDPSHYGCGLHTTGRGGRLMLHIDASRHPNTDLNQLVNCIYYCSPDWKTEYGGELELWDEPAERCVTKVEPKFNRLAIFRVSGKSWHGVPHPVKSPPGVRRNSLALYYYTTQAEATGYGHSNFVRWKGVTEHDKRRPIHVAKALARSWLPTPMINALANTARKAGINLKGR